MGKVIKITVLFLLLVIVVGSYVGYTYYQKIYAPNIDLGGNQSKAFYIPTGSQFEDVVQAFEANGWVRDMEALKWVADQKNYRNHVYPGRYLLYQGMSNNDLINLLRSGVQEPVKVTFNNIRTKAELAGKVSRYLEPDSLEFLSAFEDKQVVRSVGLKPATLMTLFLPNTYELYWNTSPGQFMEKMKRAHDSFWNEERIAKAERMGLSPEEVSILASIVQKETSKRDESARIAGVYINRMKVGMPLQADPTLIWMLGDFTIKRVLDEHKEIDSPYNTYLYAGLPPGPICMPEHHYIDAVLNYEDHKYFYFCAKEDFSGYSNFATNYNQHLINARKYQQALNKRGIYR